MKVLLLNGSPRKKGNTFIALSEAARVLEEEGLETDICWIGNRPVRGGATAAFETPNLPFQMMNMPVVTSQYWNIVYGRESRCPVKPGMTQAMAGNR